MEKLGHTLKNDPSLSDQKIGKPEETKDPKTSCLMIKKQQDLHRRLGQSQSLRRRLKLLHKKSKVPPGSLHGNSSACEPVDVLKLQQPQEPVVTFQRSMYKEVLQELLEVLRSPNTPEQQQKIIHILKSHPPLLGAFIKQRQIPQQKKVLEHSNNNGRIVVTSDAAHSQLPVETTGKTFSMGANNMSRPTSVWSSHIYGSSIGGPAEPKGLNVPLKSQITQQQLVANENKASLYKLSTSSTTFVGGTSHVENSENDDRMSLQSIGKHTVELSYSQPLSNIASGSLPGPQGGTSGGMQDNSQIHTTSIVDSEERMLIQSKLENLSLEDLEGLVCLLQLK